jgi:hypothetical protein
VYFQVAAACLGMRGVRTDHDEHHGVIVAGANTAPGTCGSQSSRRKAGMRDWLYMIVNRIFCRFLFILSVAMRIEYLEFDRLYSVTTNEIICMCLAN